ncbi:RIP metalloprotease RseP [Alteriqipengyuania sp.]|uniref:RIP metalloprotease RseP n=1 Tax=Alteriqipengyuania sp. TaxID=2800692 RepID=UPI0035121A18
MIEQIPIWMWIVGFLLVLGPLVTVHELGHLLVGRWLGVKAEAFSVGFGKELTGFTDRHGTRWRISALPLGGYVQFKGDMNPASIPDANAPAEEGAFQHAALWRRALIVAAGPVTNILVAVAIFAVFFTIIGKPTYEFPDNSTQVAGFSENSAARDAGVEIGDRIVAIDGERVDDFYQLVDRVALYPNQDIDLLVERNGREIALPVTIAGVTETDRFGNKGTVGRIGVYRPEDGEVKVSYERLGVLSVLPAAVDQSMVVLDMMVTGLGQIFTGQRSVRELGGPLSIAKYSGEQLSLGWVAFINFVALISLNLAFINLLPIPMLDGGHLALYAAEAIRRKPVGPRATELAYRVGGALVLALMLFATINDVVKLLPSG